MKTKTNTIGITHKQQKIRHALINFMPLMALVVLLGLFIVLIAAKDYNLSRNLQVILNEGIVLAIVATGAIFIFTLGTFDISLGANTLLSATIGIIVYNSTGNVFLMFLVCILTAVSCSLLSAILGAIFKLPMFVTTVAMLSCLTAIATTLIGNRGGASGSNPSIVVPFEMQSSLQVLDNPAFKIIVLACFALLCVFVFDFTKVGRRQKMLGGNPICAKMTGISLNLYAIIAFLMAGLGVGLGAGLSIVYVPSVSTGTASGIGMNIFIAIVFGGMPISGGPRSKIYAALVGGFSFILLKNILYILLENVSGTRDGISQIVSAVLFLAVVFVTSMNYRTKTLPR